MSIKPEFSLRQVKETFKTNRFEIPKGAFVGRLYWADFSKYIPTGVKLDGCYVISDNKLKYNRVVEFVISSLETAELLLKECAQSNLIGVRKITQTVVKQMEAWVGGAAQLLKPLKLAAKAVAGKVTETQKFTDNYIAALERVSVSVPKEEQPQPVTSLDDIVQVDYVPGDVQMTAVEVGRVPASENEVRKLFADGFKANQRRCKQWIIGVGKSIPGYQVLVKSSDKRTAPKIMEQVIECALLAQLSVSELSSILTA